MVETLSVAVLGAPKVGKTIIIRQFLYHGFTEKYHPTEGSYTYRPSVMFNGNFCDLKIINFPCVPSFPASGSQGLDMKTQILLHPQSWKILGWPWVSYSHAQPELSLRGYWKDSPHGSFLEHLEKSTSSAGNASIIVVGNKRDLQCQRFTLRQTLSMLVKESWKCGCTESSVKYNGHVLLFKDLLCSTLVHGCSSRHSAVYLQGALHRNRGSLM